MRKRAGRSVQPTPRPPDPERERAPTSARACLSTGDSAPLAAPTKPVPAGTRRMLPDARAASRICPVYRGDTWLFPGETEAQSKQSEVVFSSLCGQISSPGTIDCTS